MRLCRARVMVPSNGTQVESICTSAGPSVTESDDDYIKPYAATMPGLHHVLHNDENDAQHVAQVDESDCEGCQKGIDNWLCTPTESGDEDTMPMDKIANIDSVHKTYNMRLCTVRVKQGEEIRKPHSCSWCVTLLAKDRTNAHINLDFMYDDPGQALFTSAELRPRL